MIVGAIDSGRIESMLAQLKTAAQRPNALEAGSSKGIGDIGSLMPNEKNSATPKADFSAALKASLDQLSQSQSRSETLGKNFALGDDSVSLSDVMIAGQKANISFQTTIQVRNKLVSAYQDIMNMQV